MAHRTKILMVLLLAMGCMTPYPSPGGGGGPSRGPGSPQNPRAFGMRPSDVSAIYLKEGLIAASGQFPFLGRIAYFGGSGSDSTLVLITISFPTRALEFHRDGDRYRAGYNVVADMRSPAGTRRVIDAKELVRVISWQETQKNEESVIFQKFFHLTPGNYNLTLLLRDPSNERGSSYEKEVVVPNIASRGISTALVVHSADPRSNIRALPKLVASPRSAGLFGRDTIILAYVESYGHSPDGKVHYSVQNEGGARLLRDSIAVAGTDQISSGIVRIPVTSVGIGIGHLRAWTPGARDTVLTPLFVGFGDDLPVASFSDMLNYLRFYIKADRLSEIRSAPESQKPVLWGALLRDTDSEPATSQHEGLLAYFERIRQANERYRGDGTDGWLADRGKVFVTLGQPDQISSGGGAGRNGGGFGPGVRSIVWEYQRFKLRINFFDRAGLGRWTMDPGSESDFNAVAQRERAG